MKEISIDVLVNGEVFETVARPFHKGSVSYKGVWHEVKDGTIDFSAGRKLEEERSDRQESLRLARRNPKYVREHTKISGRSGLMAAAALLTLGRTGMFE